MTKLTLRSPAKINLFLRILGKRPDGYHELASLFQAVDLCDTLEFSLSDRDHLTCSDKTLPTDSSNLILKAAELYRRKTGLQSGLKVNLHKKIPIQGGLGGGSSNAATTLWAFNALNNNLVPLNDLTRWASEIGSDTSFFFSNGTAYCTGRGEQVLNQTPLDNRHFWIVKLPQGISTPQVYKSLDLDQLAMRDPLIALESFSTSKPHYFNDLEEAAYKVMPSLKTVQSKLQDAGLKPILSGSGSSFFCIGEGAMPSLEGCESFRVRTLKRESSSWYA